MPARKQRWEPMLNMAGNPVVDPSHRDMHPRSTYEPTPGYFTGAGGEPGGQGLLFAEKPYAKGYGPARSERVDAALRMAGTTGGSKFGWREPTPEEEADFPYSSNSVRGSLRIGTEEPLPPSRDLVENIKRTTIPPEHLLGLNELRFSNRSDNMDGGAMHYAGHSIVAARQGHGSTSAMKSGAFRQFAVAHEVGHHVDSMTTGIPAHPEAEGRADAYGTLQSRTGFRGAYQPKHMAPYEDGPARYAVERERFGPVGADHEWHDIAVQAHAARLAAAQGSPRWERGPHPKRPGDFALQHVTDTQGELF